MRDDIKALIRERSHCVLATAADNQPYCSLMAYTASPECTRIRMATFRNTRKFRNLCENPWVSLLIDSRETEPGQALTVEGAFQEITDETEKEQIRQWLLENHPGMKDFLDQPETAIISIQIHALVFLNGLTDVHRERLI